MANGEHKAAAQRDRVPFHPRACRWPQRHHLAKVANKGDNGVEMTRLPRWVVRMASGAVWQKPVRAFMGAAGIRQLPATGRLAVRSSERWPRAAWLRSRTRGARRSAAAHERTPGQPGKRMPGGAAKQWPTGLRPASSHRHPQGCRCCSGGRSPAPQAEGAGNRDASGNALTEAGAASSEAGHPGFPRVEVPAERALEGVGRRYSWGTG